MFLSLFPSFFWGVMFYVISFFIVFFSDEWFLVWLGMELNMLSFIVLVLKRWGGSHIDGVIKYYFIQVLSSGVFFVMVMYSCYYFWMILIFSLKMGFGPFYYWFVYVVKCLDWLAGYLLMTIQKIIPFYLIYLFKSDLVLYFSVLSLVIGIVGSIGVVKLKELMAFSSVHHMGWMFVVQYIDFYGGCLYYFIYMVMTLLSVFMFWSNNIMIISECYGNEISLVMVVMSMGGVPPLIGFFIKWITVGIVYNFSYYLGNLVLLLSVFMLFVYLRIMMVYLMSGGLMSLWLVKNKNKSFLGEWGHLVLGLMVFMFGVV